MPKNSTSSALENDKVIVSVHDSNGNLKSEQETSNIITSAGAIWFCIEQNRCESQITNPDINMINNPTWWCSLSAARQMTTARLPLTARHPLEAATSQVRSRAGGVRSTLALPPARYQAGGSIITVSTIEVGTGLL